jgi:hypothetical protein
MGNMKIYRLFALMLLACICMPSQAGQTLVINSSYYPPFTTPEQNGFIDLLYKELGKRTGLTFKIQSLPAERALSNPYLNKKHADLIPSITAAIRSMKQDGTYQKLYADTITQFRLHHHH